MPSSNNIGAADIQVHVQRIIPLRALQGEKRQCVPARLEWTCSCGDHNIRDYAHGGYYLDHPPFNEDFTLEVCCDSCGVGVEVRAILKLELTLRAKTVGKEIGQTSDGVDYGEPSFTRPNRTRDGGI